MLRAKGRLCILVTFALPRPFSRGKMLGYFFCHVRPCRQFSQPLRGHCHVNCDLAQGYAVGKPMDFRTFSEWLGSRPDFSCEC